MSTAEGTGTLPPRPNASPCISDVHQSDASLHNQPCVKVFGHDHAQHACARTQFQISLSDYGEKASTKFLLSPGLSKVARACRDGAP